MKIKVKLLNIATLLLLASGTCYAQTKEVVDSLKSIFATTKNDTTKIYAQANLCDAYRFGNIDSSTFYGQQALKLARKINFIPGQILALGFLTAPAQQQGDYPKTLQLGFEAIQLAKRASFRCVSCTRIEQHGCCIRNPERLSESHRLFTPTNFVRTGGAHRSTSRPRACLWIPATGGSILFEQPTGFS